MRASVGGWGGGEACVARAWLVRVRLACARARLCLTCVRACAGSRVLARLGAGGGERVRRCRGSCGALYPVALCVRAAVPRCHPGRDTRCLPQR
eukprot:scaffold4736_cov118-Isochrysis_galbana.AAC.11